MPRSGTYGKNQYLRRSKSEENMIINGKEVANAIKASLAEKVAGLKQQYGRSPKLAVILVGDDPASAKYVHNKELACERVGIENITLRMPADTTEEQVLAEVAAFNADPAVDGILVQLPLPKQISENHVIASIAPEKDVDGLSPANVARLWTERKPQGFPIACTPAGCMRLLQEAGVDPDGKTAVVLGRSNIVGLPVAKLLLNAGATVTVCHSRTKNLAEVTSKADILVAAIGKARFVTADMVKEGAAVIDVGINVDPATGKLCGDVDYEAVAPKAAAITPVPGGVGPMTICMLMENTVGCYMRMVAHEESARREGFVLEHPAIDVADPLATAAWWCENLGFTVTMQKDDETHTTFMVDASGRVAIELYRARTQPKAPDYASMDPLTLHFGFISKDVDADVERLTKAGAVLVKREKRPGFDGAMMRDPSGIAIQFVKREKSVLLI